MVLWTLAQTLQANYRCEDLHSNYLFLGEGKENGKHVLVLAEDYS